MTEYCFIKNGIVKAVYVCDEQNAKETAERMGFDSYVLRPNLFVGLDHRYHDGKFWWFHKDEAGNEVETEITE